MDSLLPTGPRRSQRHTDARQSPYPPIISSKADSTPQEVLEKIYREIDNLSKTAASSLGDPFLDSAQWSLATQQRYADADSSKLFGREVLAIVMHVKAFKEAMKNSTDRFWKELVERIGDDQHSIKMFAITRRFPYEDRYNNSVMFNNMGPIASNAFVRNQAPDLHPHEVFLGLDGQLRDCIYQQKPQKNVEECIYKPNDFFNVARPKQWPKEWDYPCDPQTAERDRDGPYPQCHFCDAPIISHPGAQYIHKTRGLTRCICTPSQFCRHPTPLLAIQQYPSFFNDILTTNRGVRCLAPLRAGDILGVYNGRLLPLSSNVDDVYAFTLYGPLKYTENKAWFLNEEGEATSLISGAWEGTWTRYLNHREQEEEGCNVEFTTENIGGKIRIIVKAKRDIRFGEELCAFYGGAYFGGREREGAAGGGAGVGVGGVGVKGKERRKMTTGKTKTKTLEIVHRMPPVPKKGPNIILKMKGSAFGRGVSRKKKTPSTVWGGI